MWTATIIEHMFAHRPDGIKDGRPGSVRARALATTHARGAIPVSNPTRRRTTLAIVSDIAVRKLVTVREDILTEGGSADRGDPLVKAAALAVIANPYVGRPLTAQLEELVAPSGAIGTLLGERAVTALGAPVESYGQAALVGLAGEQEHAAACLAGGFGDAFRECVGGGLAWLPSVTKRCTAGDPVDVPLAFKDELWVGSHYDAMTVRVPDAPGPDEIVVVAAVASRGRLHARLGGLTREDAMTAAGPV
jgi:hypothetical protein